MWIEKLNGEPTFNFKPVGVNDQNALLLFDPNREVFVELNELNSNYGKTQETLRHLYDGTWLNQDFAQRLNVLNNTLMKNNIQDEELKSNSIVSNKNKQEEDSSNLKWEADNKINLFEHKPNTDEWVEKLNNIDTYHFKAVRFDKTNGLLLFDPTRHVYVEINSNNSNYGSTLDNLRPLYHGRWLNSDYNDELEKLKSVCDYALDLRDLSNLRSIYILNIFLSLNYRSKIN